MNQAQQGRVFGAPSKRRRRMLVAMAVLAATVMSVFVVSRGAEARTNNKSKAVLFIHGYNPTSTNTNWYQNAWFRGGWADDGELLGHALGGHGLEWRAFASGGSAKHGVSGDAAVFTRHRRDQNLFSPTRQGRSTGASLNADVRTSSSLRLFVEGEIERGEGGRWTASRFGGGARFVF